MNDTLNLANVDQRRIVRCQKAIDTAMRHGGACDVALSVEDVEWLRGRGHVVEKVAADPNDNVYTLAERLTRLVVSAA